MMRRLAQRGAALLAAMLTVTLVATIAASAVWQQWRNLEVEGAERTRAQAAWLLLSGLDFSRQILRQDARSSGGADSLSEPWSVPLAEAMPSSCTAPLFTPPNTVVSFAPLIAKLTVVEAEPPLPSETVIEKLSVTLLLSPWMAALLGV